MEQDLLAAEAAAGRGVEEDDREGRRALFEEVRFSGTPQLQCVTQNPPQHPQRAFEAQQPVGKLGVDRPRALFRVRLLVVALKKPGVG